VFPDLSIKLELVDAKVHYVSANPDESIEVTLPSAVLDIPDPTRIHAAFDADVRQGAHHGRLTSDVTLKDLFNSEGLLRAEGFEIEGEAVAAEVPVGFLDRTLRFGGLLEAVLGPMVEAEFHARGDGELFDAAVTVQSERLTMTGQFVRHDGAITAKPGAHPTATLNVDPKAWNALASRFAALHGTTLLAPFAIRAEWTDLAVPAENRRINWPQARTAAQIRVEDISIDVPGTGRILLTGTAIALDSQAIGNSVEVTLSAMAEYDGRRAELGVSATVDNIAIEDDAARQGPHTTINCKLTDLPVELLDQFVATFKQGATEAIGPRLDVVFGASLGGNGAGEAAAPAAYTLTLAAERLNAEFAGTFDLEDLNATSSGSCNLTLRPDLLRRVTEHYGDRLPQQLWKISMERDATATVTLDNVAVPLRSNDPTAAVTGSATLAVEELALAGLAGFDPVSLSRTVVTLEKPEQGSDATFQAEAQLTHGQDKIHLRAGGTVRSLADPTAVVEATCEADMTLSPRLVALLKAQNILVLPETWQALELADAARVRAELIDLKVPLSKPFDAVAMSGSLAFGIDELSIAGAQTLQGVTLRQVSFRIDAAALGGPVNFSGAAEVFTRNKKGRIDATGSISGLDGSEPSCRVQLQARNVSVPLRLLVAGAADAVVTLNADLAGQMATGSHASLTRASYIELDITPQIYKQVVQSRVPGVPNAPGDNALTLVAPARLRIDFEEARIGLTRDRDTAGEAATGPNLADCRVALAATVPVASFRVVESSQQITIRDLSASLKSKDLSGTNVFDLRGTVQTKDPSTGETKSTPLTSSTTIRNLLGPDGRFNVNKATAQTRTNLPNLPVAVIDALARMEGRLVAGLGPVASVTINGDVPGAVSVRFTSPTVELPVDLQVQQTGDATVIALQSDINAKFMLTEQSSKALFGHVHPVFADAVASEDWILITVRQKPFYLPLADFHKNIRKLAVDARIEIGNLRMRRKGWLTEGLNDLTSTAAKLLRKVRRPSDRSGQTQTYLARFTPIDVNIQDGMLTTSEFWITSDDVGIGFQSPKKTKEYAQGGTNLVTGKYRFAMGLLGASLIAEEPFLIELIDPEAVFDVPILGDVAGDPDVLTKELRVQLVGSLTKQQARRAGRDVQDLINVIGTHVQRRMRDKQGLSWNVPPDARAFAQGVGEKHRDKNPQPQVDEPVAEDKPEPEQKPRKKRNLEDELIDQLPGLIDEFLK